MPHGSVLITLVVRQDLGSSEQNSWAELLVNFGMPMVSNMIKVYLYRIKNRPWMTPLDGHGKSSITLNESSPSLVCLMHFSKERLSGFSRLLHLPPKTQTHRDM